MSKHSVSNVPALRQLSPFEHTPGTVTIPLTKGQACIADDQDSDLADLKWCITDGYAVRETTGSHKTRRQLRMHCVILERMLGRKLEPGEECDHKDLNRLNNRRDNLRLATHSQNKHNRGKFRNNKSGCAGVHWSTDDQKWRVRIAVNGKRLSLGFFDDIEEAKAVRQAAVLKYHGDFGRVD